MLKAWGLAEMGKGTETLRGHYPFPFLSLNPCKSLCMLGRSSWVPSLWDLPHSEHTSIAPVVPGPAQYPPLVW